MLFNSFEFLVLLLSVLLLYYLPFVKGNYGKAWQVSIALFASMIFYGWEDPKLLLLLVFSCVGNSVAAARIIQYKVKGDEKRVCYWVKLAVVLNLLLLAIFKYLPFVVGMMSFLPHYWVQPFTEIPLPIGISFYTFHGISMIVDVSRGEVTIGADQKMSRSSRFAEAVRDIGFYLLFFPQLVAGPIVKAKQFWPQIAAKRFGDIKWHVVCRSLIIGYFLKMVVADNLAEQTVQLTKPWIVDLAPLDLIALLYGYSFQIFADFAGYSLIAIGLAALFGYRFPINFNFPYLSTSITEFWRRWHISLSAWLRDYLYVPLGGNRKGEMRTYINLFLVMFLGGLWHGAEWKFALWGTLHGIILAIERFCFRNQQKSDEGLPVWRAFLGWCYTFHAVTLLWLTFLMPDMNHVLLYFTELKTWQDPHGPLIYVPLFFGSFVILYHVMALIRCTRPHWRENKIFYYGEPLALGFMAYAVIVNFGAPQGFIYFQF